jgi:archaellum component FlaF (FlaF/FlaG flagellin family)
MSARRNPIMIGTLLVTLVACVTAAGGAAAATTSPHASAASGVTRRVSVSSAGAQANSDSFGASLSANGRFVVFQSYASNLVAGDTNRATDIFVRDRLTGTTRRVSVSSTGAQANGWSALPAISADGRYVVFESAATNLVPGDSNRVTDVFVRDRAKASTRRVSVPSGAGAQANGASGGAVISADGRYVAFQSSASNLVPGDTNGPWKDDIFVRDRARAATRRVSVSSTGVQANNNSYAASVSADGRYVAFQSMASNLVPGDTNAHTDIFVRDRARETTRRVRVSGVGAQADNGSGTAAISADGRYVAFTSYASNLVTGDTNRHYDVFVRDRWSGATRRVSVSSTGAQANGGSADSAFSADGRYIAFDSVASNLVVGDTTAGFNDVFVHDCMTGSTRRVNMSVTGAQANNESNAPAISADGRFIAFLSEATNLVAGDTNGASDMFVRGPLS